MEFIIEDNILKKCTGDETELTVPNGITEIWGGAFKGCPNLTTITLPDSIKKVAKSAFNMEIFDENKKVVSNNKLTCNLSPKLYVRLVKKTQQIAGQCLYKFAGQPDFITVKGVLYTYQGTESKIRIPDDVTEIYMGAFYENAVIEEVTVPSSVKEMGKWAFYWCNNLKKVVFEDNGVQRIEEQCFMNCRKLEEVHLPEGLGVIMHAAFEGTASLKRVELPKTLWSVSDGAFSLSGLETIEVPEKMKNISGGAFKYSKIEGGTIKVPAECNVAKDAFNDGVTVVKE